MCGGTIESDAVFELCQDPHRRIILGVLAEQRRSLTLSDLTKSVAKHNHHTPVTEVSKEVVTDIQSQLYHVHLPKLESVGLVEYDAERQIVEPTAEFDRLQPFLSAIIDTDPDLESPIEL